METNFRDYTAAELLGKKVLYDRSYMSDSTKKISTIKKVTSSAFRIEVTNLLGEKSISDELFSLDNGQQRGVSGRSSWGLHIQCSLISEEEENELRSQWKENRLRKEIISKLTPKLIESLTYEQLKKIETIAITK